MKFYMIFISYFFFFAVVHSFLATDYIKNEAKKHFKDLFRFYRIFYNILSIVTFAPIFLIWIKYNTSFPLLYIIPEWLYPFVLLIRIAVIGFFVYAGMQNDFLEFIGINQITGKINNEIITTGAYGIIRHPLFIGIMIILISQRNMSQLDLVIVLLTSLYFIIGAYLEERRMISTFGDKYRKYQEHVSMFIPVKWIMRKLK